MSPGVLWIKEKNLEALVPAEEERISQKQISASSEDLSDYLARETGAETTVRAGPDLDKNCLVLYGPLFEQGSHVRTPQRWL